jgi:hypothetical protein
MYGFLADLVVVIHFLFIVFVALGGLLVFRWPRAAWYHLPVAAYGAAIEFWRWTCPLTPLENRLRLAAGGTAYEGGFVDHYILPLVYPGLSREITLVLGVLVLVINITVYGVYLGRRRRNAWVDQESGPPVRSRAWKRGSSRKGSQSGSSRSSGR